MDDVLVASSMKEGTRAAPRSASRLGVSVSVASLMKRANALAVRRVAKRKSFIVVLVRTHTEIGTQCESDQPHALNEPLIIA